MTSTGRSRDYNEAVGYFLKLHGQELELRAIQLTKWYGVDLHELLSRTSVTVWEKWPSELCTLPDDECYKRTLRIMYNHTRNLSKSAKRHEAKCDLLPSEELERLIHAITPLQDSVATEAIFEDERFEIYKAISQLDGRCKDVMSLIALGLDSNEIRQQLNMTMTNLTTTKLRARKSLNEILGLEDTDECGELQ